MLLYMRLPAAFPEPGNKRGWEPHLRHSLAACHSFQSFFVAITIFAAALWSQFPRLLLRSARISVVRFEPRCRFAVSQPMACSSRVSSLAAGNAARSILEQSGASRLTIHLP